ncbi:hypothetical protein QQS21_007201 [Conoideocrella luteorostrata]|uniref:Uncharacterized protein n=1 Tax=Conoideocrella luteorostrata TaxID=1105319 RepID=A0AAJ0CL45_9HYPO|nr:hypothetical protein QQS21_007201 [Conoideocrella luteorostrata]
MPSDKTCNGSAVGSTTTVQPSAPAQGHDAQTQTAVQINPMMSQYLQETRPEEVPTSERIGSKSFKNNN